ncbi:TetR/AcrR family transcriptional regulator [Mangrovibacterium marinum]|uniref:TetR family transcriptional regulator n=1 Tax=Mangrovibacterium marinum TaxID=1639118 RepID=A0A2T5C0Q6_9BACT|nr:TetR/AcrR family transcriptional regulator [Mangrovibacterium marinum]PTN08183.1 TetR family transcriptional regulator [Mangrovibacterium marinum]
MNKDELVKLEIIGQAQKLFQQYGLKKTTMDEIATACGKAKSTLYHYFNSKEEVFDSVIEMELTKLRRMVKEQVEEQKTIQEKLKTYMIEFQKGTLSMLNVYRIVAHVNYDKKCQRERFARMMEFEKNYVLRIIQDAYDSGEFRSVAQEDLPLMAELLLAGFYGSLKYLIDRDDDYDQEKLERLADIFTSKLFN